MPPVSVVQWKALCFTKVFLFFNAVDHNLVTARQISTKWRVSHVIICCGRKSASKQSILGLCRVFAAAVNQLGLISEK